MRWWAPVVVVVAALVVAATPGVAGAVVAVLPADGADPVTVTPERVEERGRTGVGESGPEPVDVSTGSQLSTVLGSTEDDVSAGVKRAAFDGRFATDNETERAEAVADRARTLRRDAREIERAYRELTLAAANGTLDRSTVARRLATLHARAENVLAGVESLRHRADHVSALELQAAGFERATLSAATDDLEAVGGAGPQALFSRYVGRSNGTVSVDASDGLTIEAERPGGPTTRAFRGVRDGDDALVVPQTSALETARATLPDANGIWRLRAASFGDRRGFYGFAFGLEAANATGEASVRVDGSTGEVFHRDVEIGPRDDGRDPTPPDDRDDGEELTLLVVDGRPQPGASVTVQARLNGRPAPDTPVRVDGIPAGTTTGNGTLDVVLPRGEVTVTAGTDAAGATLAFAFERPDGATEVAGDLNVTSRLDGDRATVRADYRGDPVRGATVRLGEGAVGTTDANGSLSLDLDNETGGVELTISKGQFAAGLDYVVDNGSLTQSGAVRAVDTGNGTGEVGADERAPDRRTGNRSENGERGEGGDDDGGEDDDDRGRDDEGDGSGDSGRDGGGDGDESDTSGGDGDGDDRSGDRENDGDESDGTSGSDSSGDGGGDDDNGDGSGGSSDSDTSGGGGSDGSGSDRSGSGGGGGGGSDTGGGDRGGTASDGRGGAGSTER